MVKFVLVYGNEMVRMVDSKASLVRVVEDATIFDTVTAAIKACSTRDLGQCKIVQVEVEEKKSEAC